MPKIAFLFLIISNIYHESYWKSFFRGHEQHCSMYVHAKNNMPLDSYLAEHAIGHTAPTTWAHTMQAQIELLREALKDVENQKFVFVSESTIPLQSFDTVYNKLNGNNLSRFAFAKNPFTNSQTRNSLPIPTEQQYFNFQWIILNRSHAQLMVDDREYIETITKYICDNEHYPATLLAAKGLIHEVMPEDTTLVLWPKEGGYHPYCFGDLTDETEFSIIKQGIRNGWLFMRKFTKDCNLTPLEAYLAYHENFDVNIMAHLMHENNSDILKNQMPDVCQTCKITSVPFQLFFPSEK